MQDKLSEGLVVSHLGKGFAVETAERTVLCQALRKLDSIVVGDRVLISHSGPEQGRIEQLLPRRSVLQRPARGTGSRPVAANLDTIFVVLAVEPECDLLLLDQYLAVCESSNINAALVCNKIDLPGAAQTETRLAYYESLGYRLFRVSVSEGNGMPLLKAALCGQNSLFAGQSGVGKSSLTKSFLPGRELKVGSLSAASGHGRHTTTAATLYHLPDGGNLIDSPGVAIFGLAGLSAAQLAWGFREFQSFIGQCRFNDCRHVNDKDCAVRGAVESGQIPAERYQRYLKLREKMPPSN